MSNLSAYAKCKKYFAWNEILHTAETHSIDSVTALKDLQEISHNPSCHTKKVSDFDFEDLFYYDKRTFGCDRKQFLYQYSPASHSFVALNDEESVV